MAKKPSIAGINIGLLSAIVAAADANQSYFVAANPDAKALATHNPPLIEVNAQMPDPTDASKAAARPTDAGRVMVSNASAATSGSEASAQPTAPASASQFAIIMNAELPKSKKRGGGGAPVKYPFDEMPIGGSFFVPVSDKQPEPAKSLGGTVSSANLRYAEKTGEVEKLVTKRGPKNKAVIGADGKPEKVMKMMPVYKYNRRYSIRPVEAGQSYGGWVAPANGALIKRTA